MYDQQELPAGGPVTQYMPVDNYYDPYGDYYDEEGEEDMPTERELAEDAQWKLIQKNTFTRWANEHLKLVNKNIADLEFDLSDGLRLIALVEVLSGKKFSKLNRRPNFRTQKLENVTMCLRFLEEDEGIKIVNIGKWHRVSRSAWAGFDGTWGPATGQFMPVNQPFACPCVYDGTNVQRKHQTASKQMNHNYSLSNYYIHIIYAVM